jgi:hypothetical protein
MFDPRQYVVSDQTRAAAVNANSLRKRVRLQTLLIVSPRDDDMRCLRTANEGSHAYACKHAIGWAWPQGFGGESCCMNPRGKWHDACLQSGIHTTALTFFRVVFNCAMRQL